MLAYLLKELLCPLSCKLPRSRNCSGKITCIAIFIPLNWWKLRCAAAKPNWQRAARLVAETGKRTGRSPKDKFAVRDSVTESKIAWGSVNLPISGGNVRRTYMIACSTTCAGKELFVQDLFCGADPQYRLPIQIINEYAWHNLFVRQLFIRPTAEELKTHKPEFTIVSAPGFLADPKRDGTNSEVFVIVNFTKKLVLIGGTQYAGEMKKSIFGIMNFLLPDRNVFPMHCSANIGSDGVTALFFGLVRHRQDDAVGRSQRAA